MKLPISVSIITRFQIRLQSRYKSCEKVFEESRESVVSRKITTEIV